MQYEEMRARYSQQRLFLNCRYVTVWGSTYMPGML